MKRRGCAARSRRARARGCRGDASTYFDRGRFDADLKRIEAFYADRGFPDARVTGFDVQLNDEQDAVELTVSVAEGDPVLVTAVDFTGSTMSRPIGSRR